MYVRNCPVTTGIKGNMWIITENAFGENGSDSRESTEEVTSEGHDK